MKDMVVEEKETTNGCGLDLSGGMGPKTKATDKDNGKLLLDSSGGSSADVRMYSRRKRRKMEKYNFDDMTESVGNSVPGQDAVCRLSSDVFPNEPGECSPRHCRKLVLQKMHQSLDGSEDDLQECIRRALATHPESGCTTAVKESAVGVAASRKQTQNSGEEHATIMSSQLLNESENSTSTEFCRRAFVDTLMSERFSELCGLLVKNFGDVNVGRVLDVHAINSRMKDGAYEKSPALYLTDIQQVWKKLQQVGNEMAALAESLSDKSTIHYEQFFMMPKEREACGALEVSTCRRGGEKADVRKCLVCESCGDRYHITFTELSGTEIPPKSWNCAICTSKGIITPHDNCVVCEKLESEYLNRTSNGIQSINVCFVCKSEVKNGENFQTCGHSLCAHKFYHNRCLTRKQLVIRGPCWYCPSCLCRNCLKDKDDDKIVLCDSCDQAYHMYCMVPPRISIPKRKWFCWKCDREIKRIKKAKRVFEKMQDKLRKEDNDNVNEGVGLDMLVTAAKTLSHQDAIRNMI